MKPKRKQHTSRNNKAVLSGNHSQDLRLALAEHGDRQQARLERAYKQLLVRKSLEEGIIEAFKKVVAAPTVLRVPAVAPQTRKKSKATEEAVLAVGCTHVGQRVTKEQTNGFGEYNEIKYLQRLTYLEETTIELLTRHVSSSVERLHVIFLGDIVHGQLNHYEEASDTITVARQFQLATWSLAQFLVNLSSVVPVVAWGAAVGNHGRWPDQRKVPAKNNYSNLDWLVYSAIQHAISFTGLPKSRLVFNLSQQPRTIIDIRGTRISARHGDHLRGGDKQFGVPIHAMAREVMAEGMRFGAAREQMIDYYLVGDKHKLVSLPLPTGAYLINGSFVGVDDFSYHQCYAPMEPAQLLFGIHEKYRKTWQYDVKLAHAPARIKYKFPFLNNSLAGVC
jgi:hypothetical protein